MSEHAPQSYDFIGDIHGFAEPLSRLLRRLGYSNSDGAYRHPEGRRVVFLGDFIDRGPAIRETLQLVREMIDAGTALAVIGNHEYNAICFHTPDGRGDFLRSHTTKGGKNVEQHRATLEAFAGREEEWNSWIDWFKTLPFSLDLNGARAVHATWHPEHIEFLEGRSLEDEDFLRASAIPGNPTFNAVETVLKGIEIPLPDGNFFEDKQGLKRGQIRVRWWESPIGRTYRDIVFPECTAVADSLVDLGHTSAWEAYPENASPVFIGHFWLPGDRIPAPLSPNLACLDYSVAKPGGKLVAYRWEGERTLVSTNFISVPANLPPQPSIEDPPPIRIPVSI